MLEQQVSLARQAGGERSDWVEDAGLGAEEEVRWKQSGCSTRRLVDKRRAVSYEEQVT